MKRTKAKGPNKNKLFCVLCLEVKITNESNVAYCGSTSNQQTNLREEKGCTTVNQPICTPDYEDVCRDYEVEVRFQEELH